MKNKNGNSVCPECQGTQLIYEGMYKDNPVDCWLCDGSGVYFDQDDFEKFWEQEDRF